MCSHDRGNFLETSTHSFQIVLDIAEKYLDKRRTITTNNFNKPFLGGTAIIQKTTHLIRALQKYCKCNLKDVTKAKYKKGKIIGRKNNNKIVVAK